MSYSKSIKLLLVVLFIFLNLKINAQNTWTAKANFGGSVRIGAVSFSIGSKGYIGTGMDAVTYNDFWEYDPNTDIWTQKADYGGGTTMGAIGFSVGTKGYLGTGRPNGSNFTNIFYEYDPTANTWTSKANFGGGNRAYAVAFSIGSKGYVGTGELSGTLKQDFWEYDPSADTWTQKTNFAGSARETATGFAIGSKGYITLGWNGSVNNQDFWEYDPNSNSWTAKTNFPGVAREWASGFSIGNKGYLGTGYNGSGTYYQDFYEFDQSLNTWTAKTNFGFGVISHATGLSIGNYGYIGTGYNGNELNIFYQYTPGTTPSPNTNIISSISTTTATSGGSITIDGGYSITAKGVVWGTSANPTVALATKTNDGTGTGSFTSSITGLTAGTQYYYRAYATNSQGTSYGTEYTFTTTNTTPNSWARHTDFIQSRTDAVSFVVNNKAYVGTGWDGSIVKIDLWEYDPSTNIWSQKTDLTGVARQGAVGLTLNNKGYIGLGYDGASTYLQDWYEYDATLNSWTTKTSFTGVGRSGCAYVEVNNIAYVGLGADATRRADWYSYNPTTNSWTQKTSFGGSARRYTSHFAINSKAYVVTGEDGAVKQDTWEYDPTTNVWTQKANFGGSARQLAKGFAIGNKGYVTCGTTGTAQNDIWEYDASLNTWTAKTNFTGSARYFLDAFVISNLAYVGLGNNHTPIYYNDYYQYTPGTTPSPSTTIISSITATTATSGGSITIDGGYAVTAKGVVWGTSANPTVALATKTNDGSGTASFTSSITGLTAGTQYYYRAYATNSQGTSYGTEYTFTTTNTTPNSWATHTDMPLEREGARGFTIGSYGYIGPGYSRVTSSYSKDFWQYDPSTCQWTQKADYAGGYRSYYVAFVLNNIGYFATGYNSSNTKMADMYAYDPSTNTWTAKTNFPGLGRAEAASFAIGSYAYVGNGNNGVSYFNDLYRYDPTTDSWIQKANFPTTGRSSLMGFSVNGMGYMGTGNNAPLQQDMYEYNPNTNSWTSKANYGGGQQGVVCPFVIGNKAYGVGGSNTSNVNTNTLYEFDPILNTWTSKAVFLGGVRGNMASFVINNKAYVGTGENGTTFKDIYEYTPGTTASVNTNIISSITATSASSGGTVTIDGGYSITAKGVVWGTSANPTVALATKTNDGSGTASFTSSITGLSAGTQYYYRAYATNSQGTSYGTEYTFTTTQTGGTWVRQTDFPMIRDWNTGFTLGTKGYLALGYDNVYYYKDLWEYDPSTCQWTQKADFGGTVRRQATGFSIGTKAYVGTGYDGTNYLQDFWEYDQTGNTWVQKANFGGGVRGFGVGFTIGTKGYVGTGEDQASTKYNDFWEYDPSLNTWTAKANFGGVIRTNATGFSIGTKGYIGTGSNGGTYYQDFWEYDPTLNSWTAKANFGGGGRAYAVGMSINTKGYVGIGFNASNFQDWYEFDATANTWTAKSNFTGTARFAAAGFSIGSIGYLGTGYDVAHKQDFYSYSPNSTPTITTTAITSLSTTSASSGGNVLGDGGTAVTARGLVWSASSNTPTTSSYDGITSNSTGTGAFTQTINALCPGTTYYVRAYATNSAGTSYGATETFTTTASAGDIWVQKANFGGGIRVNAVGFSIGQKGYLATGSGSLGVLQNDLWEFDAQTNVWTQKANFSGGLRQNAVGFSIGSKGYLGTGQDQSNAMYKDFWEYDPNGNSWTAKTNFGGTIRCNSVGFSINGKGYIGLGQTGAQFKNDFWEYDPNLDSWIFKNNFPDNRVEASIFVANNKAFVCCGFTSTLKNDLWFFDDVNNIWVSKQDLPGAARWYTSSFSISNKGYVGLGANGGTRYNDLYEYDILNNIWIKKNDITFSGRYSTIEFSINNKAFIGTGWSGSAQQDLYEYTPSTVPSFYITSAVTSITSSGGIISAVTDANFNGCSSSAITDHGLVWHTATAPTTGTNTGSYSAGAGNGNISSYSITGLSAGTIYYVRSYSTSAQGTRYGNEVSFTTSAAAPTVTTTAISAVATTSASSGGNVTSDGGAAVTARGLVWSASSNTPTTSSYDGITSNSTGTGAFTQTINALCPGTTYYVRAYATNSAGTSYGATETFATTASAGDIWVQKANFGGTARSSVANFVIGNKAYLGTGGTPAFQQDFWEFDTYSNVWTQKANFGGSARQEAIGFAIGTKGYVGIGNLGAGNYTNDLWEYDPSTNIWTAKANFPGGDRTNAIGFSIGTKGYVGIGTNEANVKQQDWYEFDPTLNAWTSKANFGGGTRQIAVGFAINTKGYIGCGKDAAGTDKKDFWEYNPTADTWTQKTDFAGSARYYATGFGIGNKGYIGAGYDVGYLSDFYEYDPISNLWTAKANFGGGGRNAPTGFSTATKGFIGFGSNGGGNQVDLWEYVPGAIPQFISGSAGSITSSGAAISATYDANYNGCSSSAITDKGFVWHTATAPTTGTNTGAYSAGAGSGDISSYSITGLNVVTTYYVRSYSTSAQGTRYGNEVSFTTSAAAPTVTTTAISAVATTSASSGGNVTSDGGAAVTARGLVWSASSNTPTTSSYDGITSNSTGTGAFTQTVNALCPGTTYYVRAYATNTAGTAYGSVVSFTTTANAGDIWVQKTTFPSGVRYQSCQFTIGNKIYIGMGTTGFVNYDDFWEYDIFADTWTQKTSFPNGLITGTINFAINNKGYVCGGVIGGAWQKTVFEYNPSSNSWVQKNDLPFSGAFANRSNGLGLANSSRGFIIGGFDCSTGRAYTEIIEYNPNTDSWVQRPDFHTRGSSRPSGFVVDENLYLYATGNCLSVMENSFFCFNTTTNTWSNKTSYPGTASTKGIGFAIGNKGYIGTGREQSLAVTNIMYEYDVTTDIWREISNVSTAGTEYANGISLGNKAYFGLGAAIGVTWYEYTPNTIPMFLQANAVSNVTATAGSLSAAYDVNYNGCVTASVTAKGLVWSTSANPTTSSYTGIYNAGSGNGVINYTITGLNPVTTYYVRAFSTNANGTVYGNERSFTTLPDLPTITTSAISNVTINSADGGGTVSSDGGAAVTAYGMVWGETSTPTINSNRGISNDGSGTGVFTSSIISLDDGTPYYARAYATNSAGTAYGSANSFTTLALPVIADSSEPYTNVTNSTAKVSGRIVSFGNGGLIEQGFAWATHSGVTTSDTKALSSNITVGPVSLTVRNLPIASQIYFVQFVTTSLGTVYGEEFEIRTLNYTDTDGDGISDEVEQAGGNNGDSNRDGIPDYLQGGVTTVATNLPVGSNSANSLSPSGVNYITVQALGCNSISDVFTNKNLVDKNYHYPVGIVEFKVPCGTARVKIYYHNYRSLQGYVYRKLNQYGNWITYSGAVFGTENFNGKQVATVILDLKDGSNGDSDGLTDGVITDPGGPALLIEPAIIPIWDWKYVVLLMCMFGFWIYKNKIV
jgi:N-acetylneuraminic acid mutarotase